MNTYFHLGSSRDHRLLADRPKSAPKPQSDIRRCPLTTDHVDGSRRLSELVLAVSHNDQDQSMIWSWMSECLIHEQLLAILRAANLTGYRTRPATVRFGNGVISKEYRELVVTGWGGVAPPESGI